VLEKDPKNVQAFMALAQLRAKAGGTTAEVATLIGKAVTANPTDPAPRLALIGLYLGKKETKSALSAAQEAVAALPERPEILDAAGRAQQAAGDYNQALATYGKLAALQAGFSPALSAHGRGQVAAKNKDAALQNLQKALKVKPDSLEAQRGIMLLDLDAGRSKEALEVAREVQKQRPKEAIGYIFEGDAHAAQKAWVEAAAAYRVGLKEAHRPIWRSSCIPHCWPAATLPRPTSSLKRGSRNMPRTTASASIWPRCRRAQGLCRRRPTVPHSARGAAGKPRVLNNMAWVAGQLKDPKAIEYAEKANKLAPDQPALLDTLAVSADGQGRCRTRAGTVQEGPGTGPAGVADSSQLRQGADQGREEQRGQERTGSARQAGRQVPGAGRSRAVAQGAVGSRRG
jgi:tetratricopeptide (TPR) repeat protein